MEDSRAPLFSRDFLRDIPSDSIFKVTRNTLIKDLEVLKRNPLFTNKWFVLFDSKVDTSMIDRMISYPNADVIVMADRVNYQKKKSSLMKLGEYKVIDLVNPSKEFCKNYVIKELGVGDDVAKALLSRSNYFLPTIAENVNTLRSLGRTPTISDVNLYVSKRTSVTVYTLFYYLFNISNVPSKSILMFLYEFRFAFVYLKTRLLELFDVSLTVYSDVESGVVSGVNCREYLSDKQFNVTEYFLKTVINELHPLVTYEKLYLERLRFSRCENIVELLNLFL